MAWSVGVGTVSEVASGDLTLTEPASVVAGDILVACIAYRSNAAFSVPAGWTQADAQNSGNATSGAGGIASGIMAYIVRGGSAPSFAFTRTGGDVARGGVISLRNGTDVLSFDTVVGNTLAADNSVASNAGLTTALADELLVSFGSCPLAASFVGFTAATEPTSGWTTQINSSTVTGADVSVGVATDPKPNASATGACSATVGTARRHVFITAAFKHVAPPVVLTAAQGSYTTTGQAANLIHNFPLSAANGSYSTSGQAANFLITHILSAGQGSYSTTGQASGLLVGRRVTADFGSYSYNGQPAQFVKGSVLPAGFGSYSYSGFDADLFKTRRNPWIEDSVENGTWVEALSITTSWTEESAPSNTWIEEV